MSFDKRFDSRWRDVIAPAIKVVTVNEKYLEPQRVDVRKVSDSVLTEILEGITRCRIFLADVTPVDEANGRALRNANVMYEVGLAHAVRQPEEVLLFRSDDRELPFDITNVRVHSYDPDGAPENARRLITETIVESLRELDAKRALSVRRVAESLDFRGWMILFESRLKPLHHPPHRTTGEALAGIASGRAIARLLEVGALAGAFPQLTPEQVSEMQLAEHLLAYHITPFGNAICDYAANEMGLFSPENRQYLENILRDSSGKLGGTSPDGAQ